jgi:hypothetical protein
MLHPEARRASAAYATRVSSELQKMYCKAGVDWVRVCILMCVLALFVRS